MSTHPQKGTSVVTQPLVKIMEMDHIVLRVQDMDRSLLFYTEVLGLPSERVEEYKDGKVPFPSVRLNADTIIDLFASDQEPIGREGARNQDHYCMVVEPTDLEEVKGAFESMGIGIQGGPLPRWGAHGMGTSLYIYDPDDNVIELRYY